MNSLARPYPVASPHRALYRRQGLIGLSLATAICGSWIVLHIIAMFVVEVTIATLPVVLLIAALQCWLSVGMFIVAHDAMHGSLCPGRPQLNARIGSALLILYAGFGWNRMRSDHFAHHRHPGGGRDPDFDSAHPDDPVRWYRTFLTRYFSWQSALYVTAVVQAYWWIAGVPIQNLLLLYAAPAILSSIQLFYFGTYRPHRHDGPAFPDRHNARSEAFGPLVSLVTCFHFGYHHEHHLSPNVPWWALPQLRRATLREEAEP